MINQTLQQLQTNNVPPAVQKKILTIMLNQWFNAMPQAALCRQRRLTDQGKKNADRLVCYVKRQHGDQFPIDGVGETLGSVFNSSGNTSKCNPLSPCQWCWSSVYLRSVIRFFHCSRNTSCQENILLDLFTPPPPKF